MNILVFGSLNQDIVYDIDHFGQPGETTKARQVSQYPGGKGLNQAIAASQAGSPVTMAGCIGLDGTWLTALLEEKGVQTGHVHTLEAARTGTAIIERDPAGHNRILLDPGANSLCTLQQIQDTLTAYQPGDLLICQNETSLTRQLVQEAGSRQLQILFNPAPMTADIRDMDLSGVPWLAVNETDVHSFWTPVPGILSPCAACSAAAIRRPPCFLPWDPGVPSACRMNSSGSCPPFR